MIQNKAICRSTGRFMVCLVMGYWLLLLVPGCANERVIEGQKNLLQTPYDAYAESLRMARLDATTLGRTWLEAGHRALESPLRIDSPFREVGYLDPRDVMARGYQIQLLQGQRLEVAIAIQDRDSLQFFVDLFEAPEDTTKSLRHVAIADSLNRLVVEARENVAYILRVQPELLRGGRYTVDIQVDASLGFPVAGKNSRAIGSFFGAERDGGRRSHMGVDIFAPKGTPVIAAASGYIARIDNTTLGGKIIWLRDATRNQAYYYAHLNEQLVSPRMRVEAGDTLGLVGNTGNAITTPSHLHFGIYTTRPRRAVDPLPYIKTLLTMPDQLAVDTTRFGQWARVTASVAYLRALPYSHANKIAELPIHTAVKVVAGSGDWYRVTLPDGGEGFILAHQIEDTHEPLRNLQLAAGQPVRNQATPSSIPIDTVGVASELPVFGEYGDYVGVTTANGRTGWVSALE